MHWLTWSWWRWLIAGQSKYGNRYYPKRPVWVRDLNHLLCRLRGHPAGPVWQNVGGLEPDWRCRSCDDKLG